MANKIPEKTRQRIYDRATPKNSVKPACELTGETNNLQIHHITGRHSHDPINLILLDWIEHKEVYDSGLYRQLKLGMRDLLSRWYPEEEVADRMGGKIPAGKLTNPDVKAHFYKVEDWYF